MKRTLFIASCTMALVDGIVAELRAAGYSEIEISSIFLRRARIVSGSPTFTREVIVDPRTGEILRDYREANRTDEAKDTPDHISANGSGSSGSGSGLGGSGSGSSGSGGHGSGSGGPGGSGGGDDD